MKKELPTLTPYERIPEKLLGIGEPDQDQKEGDAEAPLKDVTKPPHIEGWLLSTLIAPNKRHVRNAMGNNIREGEGQIAVEIHDSKIPRKRCTTQKEYLWNIPLPPGYTPSEFLPDKR